MFALIENNEVKQLGEPAALFPNTSGANAAYALEQGALEVVEGGRKDERFYWVSFSHYDVQADKVVRVYSSMPKALEDVTEAPEGANEPLTTKGLKSVHIEQAKASAGAQLARTDWMVTRKFERGVDIPADVAAERAKIVADCDAKEAAIAACTTVEELIVVVENRASTTN